jgi:hypothetical protein
MSSGESRITRIRAAHFICQFPKALPLCVAVSEKVSLELAVQLLPSRLFNVI